MRFHRLPNRLPKFYNAILSIGSFDGVHLGHKFVLEQMKKWASDVAGETVVVTFDPHPRSVLFPEGPSVPILSTLQEKALLLEKESIDHMVIVPFDLNFAQQSAESYIEKFLLKIFQPIGIIVGYDHRFGKNRTGNFEQLKSYEGKLGLHEVRQLEAKTEKDISISSTKIRSALIDGDIALANSYLGHPYILKGTVVRGLQLGRTLGFPTANLRLDSLDKLIPPYGIYAATAVHETFRCAGMLYIGDRPTIDNHNNTTIEIHLFDFDKDIYDKDITIEIHKFIRQDKKLEDLDALKEQLEQDQATILTYFNTTV